MNEESINFIKNSKVTLPEIKENITINGNLIPQRFIFVKLKKYVNDFLKGNTIEPRMIGIAGIRGVGKTTILWQIANLVKKEFKNVDVYYISLDIARDYNFSNPDIIEAIKRNISGNRKVVFLFDEVQYMKNWDLMLKIIYDKFKNTFIIATGSSSLLLNSSVDLSTRWTLESLYPLSFTEFIMIKTWIKTKGKIQIFPEKGLGSSLKSTLFNSSNIKELENGLILLIDKIEKYLHQINNLNKNRDKNTKIFFQNYLNEYIFYHNIPRLLYIEEKKEIIRRIFDMLKRVLYQDIKEFYEENDIYKIGQILTYLAFLDEINKEKISGNFEIKKDKVNKIVSSLIKSELLINFSLYGGIKTSLKKEKLFFISPSIRYAIIKQIYEKTDKYHSKLYEDIVALYLKKLLSNRVFYGGGVKNKSPDFIIEGSFNIIPLEIGTQKRDLSQLNLSDVKYGILLNAKEESFKVINNKIIIPLKWFLLM